MRSISFWLGSLEVASHDLRRQYQYMNNTSGVGVLDKAVSVLAAVESGPATLAQLVSATGLARPTDAPHRRRARASPAARQGRAGQVRARTADRRAGLGRRRGPAARRSPSRCSIQLRDLTGESAQLYRRQARRPGLRRRRRAGQRPARHGAGRRGAADDRGLGRAGAARLGGGRADAPRAARRQVHRGHAGQRAPARLGRQRRRTRARRRLGVRPGRAARAARCSPPSPCPARSSG